MHPERSYRTQYSGAASASLGPERHGQPRCSDGGATADPSFSPYLRKRCRRYLTTTAATTERSRLCLVIWLPRSRTEIRLCCPGWRTGSRCHYSGP